MVIINNVEIPTEMDAKKEVVKNEFMRKHKLSYQRMIIDVTKADLIKKLVSLGYTNFRTLSPEDKFKTVIQAMADIKSGTGVQSGSSPADPLDALAMADKLNESPEIYNKKTGQMEKNEKYPEGLGSRTLLEPYVKLAILTKLVGDVEGDKSSRREAEKTPLQKEKKQFEQHPSVKNWLDDTSQKTKGHNISTMLKVLKIIDMSPEMFLKGESYKKEWVDDGTGKKEFLWIHDPTGKKAETHKDWKKYVEKMVGFTNKNFKTWVDSDGKTWNLIEWAYAPSPNVIAGNNQFTKMGDVISSERSGGYEGGGGVEKKMKEAIKHYMGSNIDKFQVKKYPSTDDWFHIGAPVLHYGTLHMDAKNIRKMETCLQEPELKFTEIFRNTLHPPAEKWLRQVRKTRPDFARKKRTVALKYQKVGDINKNFERQNKKYQEAIRLAGKPFTKDWETSKEDWDNAYHYFMYAVEIGWRANEAFTCGTSWEIDKIDGLKTSAIFYKGNSMWIKFLIRKTWHLRKEDRMTSSVIVLDKNIQKLVEERIDQVKNGIESKLNTQQTQAELYKKYKIYTWYQEDKMEEDASGKKKFVKVWKNNSVHSLIGADGYYIKVGTMEKQAQDDMTDKELTELRERGQQKDKMVINEKNQKILRAIMRNCYAKSFPEEHKMEKYWTSNSLHSLRHVFAQAWLTRSKGDFSWVAERGHWGGIAILEQAYGKPNPDLQLAKSIQYSETSLAEAEVEVSKPVEDVNIKQKLNLTEKQLQEVIKMTMASMNYKSDVTTTYAEANPELSEGASTSNTPKEETSDSDSGEALMQEEDNTE